MSKSKKVMLISGASSGIGEAIARQAALAGHIIILAARRLDRLKKISAEINGAGGSARCHSLDVTKQNDFTSVVDAVIKEFGQIDVIVNNAGLMPLSPMKSLKVDEWERMIDVNIKGVLYGIAAVLPSMEQRGTGHIINVASIGAHMVVPTGAVYCATKYAVWAISDGLRQEMDKVRVTTISPGVVDTELADTITDGHLRKLAFCAVLCLSFVIDLLRGRLMTGQAGFFDFEDRLKELSAEGDPLEKLTATVDFEIFRPVLAKALGPRDPAKGGRPPFDLVLKFKMLVLQSLHGLSLAQTSYMVRDRLSWMRFCGLCPGDKVPDENTLWDFREALIASDALDTLFERLDETICAAGYLPMGGQIVDATLVAAPKQRNNDAEKDAIKEGRTAAEIWPDDPAKAAQKDTDARWTVKFSKAKTKEDGTKHATDIAIPTFGYKNHISIDKRHGLIRRGVVSDAAAHDGARLREGLIDPNNTASDVWADTAYRSQKNEAFLQKAGKVSRIHIKKPKGKPMPPRTAKANAKKSKVRALVEHVFAEQKQRMGLFVRTIGFKRAEAAITLANMAYNMKRWCWLERRTAFA